MLTQLLVTALTIALSLAQQPGDVADAFMSAELIPDGEYHQRRVGSLGVLMREL